MRSDASVRELSDDEQRQITGGVMEGGCIDPLLQWLIDILTGTTQP